MNNFGDWSKSRIIEAGSLDQNFQRAAIAFMRELGLEHVETKFVRQWLVSLCGNELKLCIRINEAADQPRACHAIYVDAFTGNPDLSLQVLSATRRSLARLLA